MEVIKRKRCLPPIRITSSHVTELVPSPIDLKLSQVLSNLFISSYKSAKDLSSLKARGITHILNLSAAHHCVNLYSEEFTYCSVAMPDSATAEISPFIEEAMQFITQAIVEGGKVLIHCYRGKSRAPTIACAYLIRTFHFTLKKAMRIIRKVQPFAQPNFGFISQLSEL